MSERTFVFCDFCNQTGIRSVEQRRDSRRGDRQGRRVSDDRSWFEGDVGEALSAGWYALADGRHVCPRCQERSQLASAASAR